MKDTTWSSGFSTLSLKYASLSLDIVNRTKTSRCRRSFGGRSVGRSVGHQTKTALTCQSRNTFSSGVPSIIINHQMAETADTEPLPDTSIEGNTPSTEVPSTVAKKRKQPMTLEDKIAEATRLKDAGNEFFKKKLYKKALVKYNTVFAYVWQPNGEAASYSKETPASDKQQAAIDQIKFACWGNISACHLQCKDPRKALDWSNKILAEAGTTVSSTVRVKALTRAGQALLQMNDLDKAKEHLSEAYNLDPQNAAVRSQWKKLQDAYRKHKQAEKNKFGGMFAN
jgi:tetratricopeptide (TPR) repeat protein